MTATTTPERSPARTTYDAMAPHYDAFTSHHDYDHWTRQLEAAARRHGLAGTRLLDVGCGTGKSFAPFLARGWEITACDVSLEMLRVARRRAGGRVPLHRRDMRELGVLGGFDFITCLDDAVNHLLEDGDLERAFAAARANAAPGCVYLFDVNTLATYRGFFSSTLTIDDEAGGRFLVWEGHAGGDAGPGARCTARFVAFERRGERWRRTDVRVEQRHHPAEAVRESLEAAGWECAALYGQGLDGRLEPELDELRHTKAVFVARAGY